MTLLAWQEVGRRRGTAEQNSYHQPQNHQQYFLGPATCGLAMRFKFRHAPVPGHPKAMVLVVQHLHWR